MELIKNQKIYNVKIGGYGLLLQSFLDTTTKQFQWKILKYQNGIVLEESTYDRSLLGQQFFEENGMKLITRLANLILFLHERGYIDQAVANGLIKLIAKDILSLKKSLKSGLKWLDQESDQQFGNTFVNCFKHNRKSIIDYITFEIEEFEEQSEEINFFSLIRDLVFTGYFTTELGIKDLDYVSNIPNLWDGIPWEVLKDQHEEYNEAW